MSSWENFWRKTSEFCGTEEYFDFYLAIKEHSKVPGAWRKSLSICFCESGGHEESGQMEEFGLSTSNT